MASCDNTVLTGQEGLIQFKPLGTTNCVDDYCPFVGTRIYLPCSADYDIGDCLEVELVKIPSGEGVSYDGGNTVIKTGDTFYVVNDGKGAEGDVDNCGNDMEGVPYIEVSLVEDGTPIIWDISEAGEAKSEGVLTGEMTITNGGTLYNGSVAESVPNIELSNKIGTGRGAVATVDFDSNGAATKVLITSGGSGYKGGDILTLAYPNVGGQEAVITVPGTGVVNLRGNSAEGNYVFRLCEFQTVCGVRSFSIDLSRDELDVTTLPCSTGEACGKELASFRKTQAGFASATGSLEVYFTCDQESIQNKILQGSLQRTQGGASVRLYVCTKTNPDGTINESASLYIEADIQLLGMSFSVNPDDPTTATINFGVTQVTSAFGLS
jgi:hypothetical protein